MAPLGTADSGALGTMTAVKAAAVEAVFCQTCQAPVVEEGDPERSQVGVWSCPSQTQSSAGV